METTQQIDTERLIGMAESLEERTHRAAIDSLQRLAAEVNEAIENVEAWHRREPARQPELYHQRIGDAVTDVARYADAAMRLAETREVIED